MNIPEATFAYQGDELSLFAHARKWKAYFTDALRPYIGDRVLEVGAGIGGTTRLLCSGKEKIWLCLEPDGALAGQLTAACKDGRLPGNCRVEGGKVTDLDAVSRFDTIIYIDVLEHIEEDAGELANAAGLLSPGGRLIVLSPAYQWLFSEFDATVGHCRRYTAEGLRRLAPPDLRTLRSFYLDSVGLIASAANRILLHSEMPNNAQIHLWDNVLVPISKLCDGLTGRTFGRSVIVIWEKQS